MGKYLYQHDIFNNFVEKKENIKTQKHKVFLRKRGGLANYALTEEIFELFRNKAQ